MPVVYAGLLAGDRGSYWDWLGLAAAFDLLFGTVCTLTFEHVIEE